MFYRVWMNRFHPTYQTQIWQKANLHILWRFLIRSLFGQLIPDHQTVEMLVKFLNY